MDLILSTLLIVFNMQLISATIITNSLKLLKLIKKLSQSMRAKVKDLRLPQLIPIVSLVSLMLPYKRRLNQLRFSSNPQIYKPKMLKRMILPSNLVSLSLLIMLWLKVFYRKEMPNQQKIQLKKPKKLELNTVNPKILPTLNHYI